MIKYIEQEEKDKKITSMLEHLKGMSKEDALDIIGELEDHVLGTFPQTKSTEVKK